MRAAALIERGRVNPGYLKLDLLCRGLRFAPGCRLEGAQAPQRRRAGLGSGLELRLPGPGRIHVNVPVTEAFAAASPYELDGPGPDGRHVLRRDGRDLAAVEVPPRPAFLDRTTSSGRPMGEVGVLQGTCLGIYFGPCCANWKRPDEDACRFCAVGLNLRAGDESTAKTIADVVETARAARDELGVTFVHVNGGYDETEGYLDRYLPLMEALRDETGMLTGLQIPPLEGEDAYRRVKAAGVNNVSLCYELWDEDRFRTVCPGKHERSGLEGFRRAIRICTEEVGFDTVNGEMIAGLEDVSSSRAAVDWLTDVGAIPTICVFRPVAGTALEAEPPPTTEALVPLFAHAWRRTLDRGLPMGIAPNVHVSIVLTPEEWRWLVPPAERRRRPLKRLRQAALRVGFRTVWRLRGRPVGRRPSPA